MKPSPGVPKNRFARSQRMPIVNGILVVAISLVVLQLWLLTATMNAFLGGDTTLALPAQIVSAVCLALNVGLVRYLNRLS